MTNPVKLSVKAPNHRVTDQKFSVDATYTVKDLKEYLQLHYPGKPHPRDQKLIYMGKLLTDQLKLTSVLKPNLCDADGWNTIHLVCSPSEKPVEKNMNKEVSEGQDVRSKSSQETVSSISDVFTSAREPPPVLNSSPMVMPTSSVPAIVPGMPYTPEQMMWMQQIYAQQMANYMQLMYHGYQYGGVAEAADTVEGRGNENVPAAAAAPRNQPQNNQQQMVMNAAGGQAVFEDEEEELNRDWLDWSYVMCRFVVLLAIVYFYSTLGRFFMVFGFFFLIYLYQNGWFQLNRRVARPNARRPQEEENEVQENNEAETEEDTPPEEEAAPGTLKVILSFFLTFFTSLIPQQPGAVNAN